jgi:hypothetical protein
MRRGAVLGALGQGPLGRETTHRFRCLRASRLPGKPLQVGAACWSLAGWSRWAEFELALDDWAKFGLSRFSASRGRDTLERLGLIASVRRLGRYPVVTMMDANEPEC